MIKVNLLGDSTKNDYTNRYLLVCFILLFILSCVVAKSLYSRTEIEVSQMSLKVESMKEQLRRLEERTKIVKKLEKKKASFRKKLLVLANVRTKRIGPVRILDDLNVSIPEYVWIREISENNGKMMILGRALDNHNIAMLIKELQKSPYFKTVDLVESRQVYYSKRSGQVTSTPDIQLRRSSGKESRVTKSRTFSVRGKKSSKNSGRISEGNIRIKEFVLRAWVRYEGDLTRHVDKEIEYDQEIEFPEIKELKGL